MVLLTVKGTKHLDEFTFECDVSSLNKDITPTLVHMQNMRFKVKNQLSSWRELISTNTAQKAVETQKGIDKTLPKQCELLVQEITAAMKDSRTPVVPHDLYDRYWTSLRDFAIKIFPNDCSVSKGKNSIRANNSDNKETGDEDHADESSNDKNKIKVNDNLNEPSASDETDDAPCEDYEAAIHRLYGLYDNPDIDEDYRLFVYHCRLILDPLWASHDCLDEQEVLGKETETNINESNEQKTPQSSKSKTATTIIALWFCGKELPRDDPIGKICQNNNKSRITVKLAASGGLPPALEPRISYNEQRSLRRAMLDRNEKRKHLEESELNSLVNKQRAFEKKVALRSGTTSSEITTKTLNVGLLGEVNIGSRAFGKDNRFGRSNITEKIIEGNE